MSLRDVRDEVESLGESVRELLDDVDVMHGEVVEELQSGFKSMMEQFDDMRAALKLPPSDDAADAGEPDSEPDVVEHKALALRVSALELTASSVEKRLASIEQQLLAFDERLGERMNQIQSENVSVQRVAKLYKDKIEHMSEALDNLSHSFAECDAKVARLCAEAQAAEGVKP